MGSAELSDERKEALAKALARPRFELIPTKGAREQAAYLPEGTKVAVACSPAQGIENTLLLGEELLERGFRIVPHISARLVTDRAHLEEIGRRLYDLDVREVFVIGGDVGKPAGPFTGAFELLRAMADLGRDFEHIGIGGYPERHPIIDDETLRQALLDKQPFATYVVSQMCFDPGRILDLVADIRQRGIELPVYVGLPGVVERKKLLQIVPKIGVGNSARFLTKHTNLLAGFFRPGGYRPDELVEKLAPYVGDRDYDIAGFHVYTFNHVESTERWRQHILDFEQASSPVGSR